jgi:hypothetical protein
MIDKSFQLLRTNPLLTTNLSIVVDTSYNIYLETINSNQELSSNMYKHYKINRESFLEDKLPEFYDGLPKEHAFYVKYDDDNDVVYNDYKYQFDDIYYAGSNYINDKWYTEEFEYLAPLYVRKNDLPKGFIILRVDDPGVYNFSDGNYEIGSLNKDNFRSEIIDKWKSVAYFDLTTGSNLGYWLDRNINQNERFPASAFEFDARSLKMSRWFGMDYSTGVYTEKPMYLDKNLSINNPHFKFEKVITEGYKNNSLVYPYIFNMKFLFDDTPATPFELKKYSLNRYFGFYVDDLEFVTNLTSYVTPDLISGTTLINNIIVSGDTGMTWDICDKEYVPYILSVNPFVEDWDEDKKYYIYVKDDLHEVKRIYNDEIEDWVYKLITEEILDDYWDTGATYDKTVNINYDDVSYPYISSMIETGTTTGFTIDEYLDCDGTMKSLYADLYLIKINDRFHVLKNTSGLTEEIVETDENYIIDKYYIQTDFAITSDSEKLKYWIGGDNSEYYREIDIENINRKPLVYSIYKVKFADIKDFDYDRVHTNYSDFDYEKSQYYDTTEEKIYTDEFRDDGYPRDKKREERYTEAQYKISNISSEYSAIGETFEITQGGDMSDLWRKNQSICKWGFMGSNSHSDYPYKLNNNRDVGGVFNRMNNVFKVNTGLIDKNMDHMYRVGNFYDHSGFTSMTDKRVYYKKQTTNIQSEYIARTDINGYNQNGGDGFNIGMYFESSVPSDFDFDYFNFYFNNKEVYEDDNVYYDRIYTKFATFNGGDNYNPPVAMFKGIKFKIYQLDGVVRNDDDLIDRFITTKSDKYNNYKMSVLLNDVYFTSFGSNPYLVNGVTNFDGILNVYNNGIHVIINEIYKNILIIVNVKIDIASGDQSFNNIQKYKEKDGLYTNKDINGTKVSNYYDPSLLSSYNFITALNDLNNKHGFDNYVSYYYIRKDSDGLTETGWSKVNGTNQYVNCGFLLECEIPDSLKIKKDSFVVDGVNGPLTSKLYNKKNILYNTRKIDEPLARSIRKSSNVDNIQKSDIIYRYSGPYEPIFKDIQLFQTSVFCYMNFSTGTTITTGDTMGYASGGKSDPIFVTTSAWNYWNNINSICQGTRTPYVYITAPSGTSEYESEYLVVNGFDLQIPMQSHIYGIEVTVERKTHVTEVPSRWVKDHTIRVSPIFGSFWSYWSVDNKSGDTYWTTDYTEVTYGGPTDLWGGSLNDTLYSEWTPAILNSDEFSVIIRTTLKNDTVGDKYDILPDVKCVSLKVYYEASGQTLYYSDGNYFDENFKFDENLSQFGLVSEVIHSKVNIDNKNILKFDDAKYPMVDQYGYSYSDRFIFKSTWDNDYYLNTLDNFEDDSTQFVIPTVNRNLLNITVTANNTTPNV